MIGLFLNELLRFWYRLSIRWLVAIVLAGLTLGGVVVFFTHTAEGPDVEALKADQQRQIQDCLSSSGGVPLQPGETMQDLCAGSYYGYYEDKRFCPMDMLVSSACEFVHGVDTYGTDISTSTKAVRFSDMVRAASYPPTDPSGRAIGVAVNRGFQSGYFTGLAALAMMLAALIGSTFVGAEYRAGTVESALVVEPRRRRLLAARFLAGTIGTMVVTLGVLGFHLLTLVPTLLARSDSDAVLPGFWGDLVWTVVRASLICGAVALVAMSLCTIGKHTVAGVGGLLGYLIVGQILVLVIATSLRPIEFVQNVVSVITNSDVIRVHTAGYQTELVAHGPTMALGYVAAYVVFATAVASLVFVRRDVD